LVKDVDSNVTFCQERISVTAGDCGRESEFRYFKTVEWSDVEDRTKKNIGRHDNRAKQKN
jgi:hypothetical protein